MIHPSVGIFCRQALERVGAFPALRVSRWSTGCRSPKTPNLLSPALPLPAAPPLLGRKAETFFWMVSAQIISIDGHSDPARPRHCRAGHRDIRVGGVINEAMARQFWPNEDPIGQKITFDSSPEEKPRQIVGVVGNVKQFGLTHGLATSRLTSLIRNYPRAPSPDGRKAGFTRPWSYARNMHPPG